MKITTAAYLILLVLSTATASQAQNWYFDKDSIGGTCSNTGPGTITQPFCSIFGVLWDRSWNGAQAGDTIYIRQGTYTGRLFWIKAGVLDNGTPSAPITIRPYPDETVIFDGQSADLFMKFSGSTNYVHDLSFVGPFEVKNYKGFLDMDVTTSGIVRSNLVFDGWAVHDGGTGPIFRGVKGLTVKNSTFYNLKGLSTGMSDHSEGICIYGTSSGHSTNILIQDCTFHDINDGKGGDNGDSDGIHIGSYAGSCQYVDTVTIKNIKTWNMGEDGIDITGTNIEMENIESFHNGASGIKLWTLNRGNTTATDTLKNVLVWGNRETGLKVTNFGETDNLNANIYQLTAWGNGEDGVKNVYGDSVNSNGPTINLFNSIIGAQRDTDFAYYTPRTGASAHTNFNHTNIYHTGSSTAITPYGCSPLSGKYTAAQYLAGSYNSDLAGGKVCGGVYGTIYGTSISPSTIDPLLTSAALAFKWEVIAQSSITSNVVTLVDPVVENSYPWPIPVNGHYIELNFDGVRRQIVSSDSTAHTITFTPAVSSTLCGRATDCRGVMVTGWATATVPTHDFSLTSSSPAKNAGLYVQGIHCALADDKGGTTLNNCIHWYGTAPDLGYSPVAWSQLKSQSTPNIKSISIQ